MEEISPKFKIELIKKIHKTIWDEIEGYDDVEIYMNDWRQKTKTFNEDMFDYQYHFKIQKRQDNGRIDIKRTLESIDNTEILFKIAIELGIETPNLIPCIPIIKQVLSEPKFNYETVLNSFDDALKKAYNEPANAVGLANSTLESVIKHILENPDISEDYSPKKTLYDQTQTILKEFALFPSNGIHAEIKKIGSSLLTISQTIEGLRSDKTSFHGADRNKYIIDDNIYAFFIINCVSTIGLFLISFYEKKYKNRDIIETNDEIPF